MHHVIRNAILMGRERDGPLDIVVENGRIADIGKTLDTGGEQLDLGGKLATPGMVETHIHLDKACIIDRCAPEPESGPTNHAARVAEAKKTFTVEDVHARASRTLEKCILNGATRMRTHVEIDPPAGLISLEGVMQAARDYAWAIDVEVCAFPQEGLTQVPETDPFLVEALKRGARCIGAAPGYDTDPKAQIDRVFELAREFDVDIDMHLDFGNTPNDMDVHYVCDLTEKFGYGGRVAVGHVTKMSVAPPDQIAEITTRLVETGVAVTVLPATDLFLMGRDQDRGVRRGVLPAHRLIPRGVTCSLSSNNILNPFTPFGDGALVRMANMYANIAQASKPSEIRDCFHMASVQSAKLLRQNDYGIEVGNPADIVVFDAASPEQVVAEVIAPEMGFKRGRHTFTRRAAELHRPT
jgi:cytosine deaminase